MKTKKRNIIIIIIVVIILIIGGFSTKIYLDNIEKSRVALLNTLKDNELNNEEIKFLKDKKFISEEQLKQLNDIVEKLKNEKIEKSLLEEIKTNQETIYASANKGMVENANKVDAEYKKKIEKLKEQTNEEKEVKNKIKTTIDQKAEEGNEKDIVIANIKTIKEKDTIPKQVDKLISIIDARKEIEKYGFDKNAILKGNYSSLAGTWVDKDGNEIIINDNNEIFLCNKFIKLKPASYNGVIYTIFSEPVMSSVGCGGFMVGVYPVGVKYNFGNTDTSKVRLVSGNGIVAGDPLYYRK